MLRTFRNTLAAAMVATAALSAGIVPAHAIEASVVAAARTHFLKAVAGDGGAVRMASDQFRTLLDQEPDNALLRAYYGSCLALQGREAWMPWNKMRLTEDGLAQIDKALGLLGETQDRVLLDGVPAGIEARLVAASTFIALPSMFNRFDAGRRVIEQVMQDPRFATIPAVAQSRFHFQAALVARKDGRRADEAAQLRRMLEADPSSPDAAVARRRLAEIGS